MPELEWAAWVLADLLAIVEYIVEDKPDAAYISNSASMCSPSSCHASAFSLA